MASLFLLGGDTTIFESVADAFVPAAGGDGASIALLLAGAPGWEDYVPRYTQPWVRRGVEQIQPIVPEGDGALNLAAVSARLNEATGIFIGGGHTPTYHRLYATEPVRSIIRERYQAGIPVAGLSAGALIIPELCAITPEDTGDASVRIVAGLGLISGLMIGVHFSEWNTLPHLLEAMSKTGTSAGLGIDGAACAIFEDGQFRRALGESVYRIEVTDFKAMAYRVIRAT